MSDRTYISQAEIADIALKLVEGEIVSDLDQRSDWPSRAVKALLDDHRLIDFSLCETVHDTCYGADWPCDVVQDIIQASGHCKHHWLPAYGSARVCQICDRWEDAR